MYRVLKFALLFATLVFFWVWLNESVATDVLLTGVFTALILALAFKHGLAVFSDLKPDPRAFGYALLYIPYFFKELVKSNLQLAAIVLAPRLPVRPGIIKVRTSLKSRMGRMLLANSISLTPGTLTVEMSDEWLYVHCVTVGASDAETATKAIVSGFERYLVVMYG
jgi:multicomponent Na+:H+ antiporter subunit E